MKKPMFLIAGCAVVLTGLSAYLAYGNVEKERLLNSYAAESSARMVVLAAFRECRSGLNADPETYCILQAAAFAGLNIPEAEADRAALELAGFMGVEAPILEKKVAHRGLGAAL